MTTILVDGIADIRPRCRFEFWIRAIAFDSGVSQLKFVVATVAFAQRNPDPILDDLARGLSSALRQLLGFDLPHLDPRHAEAALGTVEGDTLDQAL